jgi:type II secretory pathway pseudopilin PulG
VEVLVAITILLIAVTGPIAAIGRSLSQMAIARDQIIAVHLAQEGIEAMRQKRDSNVLEMIAGVPGVNWMTNLAPVGYTLDVGSAGSPNLSSCGGACVPQPVVADTVTGFYRQGVPGSGTLFSRLIMVNPGGGSIERKITARVTWQAAGATRSVEVSESIFNWTN